MAMCFKMRQCRYRRGRFCLTEVKINAAIENCIEIGSKKLLTSKSSQHPIAKEVSAEMGNDLQLPETGKALWPRFVVGLLQKT